MPLHNLNNDHFTPAEMQVVTDAWTTILNVLTPKSRALSPEDRKRYGSVAEQNKLIVLKSLEYHQNQPALDCPDVNYAELEADWADRKFLAGLLNNMKSGATICNNIRILHDYDAFRASTDDYKYARYKITTESGAGWEGKYLAMKSLYTTFEGSKKKA